jgi:hypothetical protein
MTTVTGFPGGGLGELLRCSYGWNCSVDHLLGIQLRTELGGSTMSEAENLKPGQKDSARDRKAYMSPELIEYGSVQKLTQADPGSGGDGLGHFHVGGGGG